MPDSGVKDDVRPHDTSRFNLVAGCLVAAAMLAVGLFALNPYPVGVLHDDAVYVILAKALATGHGYRYLNLPGEPLATHFPPGYPLLLAALWRLAPDFPGNVVVFKCANAVLLVVGYLALVTLLRKRVGMSLWAARGVAFVAVAGIPMLFVSTLVLSETLFFAMAAIGFVVAESVLAENERTSKLVIAGVVCGVVALVRTPGIALLAAMVACLLLRRRVRAAVIVGVAGSLVLGPWLVWARVHGQDVPGALQGAYGSYTGWLGDALRQQGPALLFRTIAVTARQALDVVAVTVGTFSSPTINLLAVVLLLPVAAMGVRAAWRRTPVFTAFLALYLVLVLIWPSGPARYIWGIWPFVSTILALGLYAFVTTRPERRIVNVGRVAVMTLALLPIVGYARYNLQGYRQRTWLAIPAQGAAMLRPLVIGIRDHVPAGAVVASTAEAAVYLYTGRPTVPMYTFTVDDLFKGPDLAVQTTALAQILRTYPTDAIVGSGALQQTVLRRLELVPPGKVVPIDSFPGSVVYRCQECVADRTR